MVNTSNFWIKSMSKCSVGHAGTLCSALSSLLCLVVVWSWDPAAVSKHHVQVRKGCKWKNYKQWCIFGRKLSIVATQKNHMKDHQKEKKQANLFPGMSRKWNYERRKEIPQTDPDPSTEVTVLPEGQRIFSSHSGEVIKPLIFIIEMKKKDNSGQSGQAIRPEP